MSTGKFFGAILTAVLAQIGLATYANAAILYATITGKNNVTSPNAYPGFAPFHVGDPTFRMTFAYDTGVVGTGAVNNLNYQFPLQSTASYEGYDIQMLVGGMAVANDWDAYSPPADFIIFSSVGGGVPSPNIVAPAVGDYLVDDVAAVFKDYSGTTLSNVFLPEAMTLSDWDWVGSHWIITMRNVNNSMDFYHITGEITDVDISAVAPNAVPEPATIMLMGAGLGLAGAAARKRKSVRA